MATTVATILAALSAVIVAMSLFGAASPSRLLGTVRGAMAWGGTWLASGVRVVLAVLLWLSAPLAHTPVAFKVFAVIAVIAAGVLLLLGSGRVMRILDRVAAWPSPVMRVWCLFGAAFGGFLLWSSSPGWWPV